MQSKIKAILTHHQIQLIQQMFREIIPVSNVVAELFYHRLFELDPNLRPLFKNDMQGQQQKLMDMLQIAVYGLEHLSQLVPALEQMGSRHYDYGVTPAHYAKVGEALFWTLEQGLEERFTPEHQAAWQEVYTLLSRIMIQAKPSPDL